jgi:hypothetical protein
MTASWTLYHEVERLIWPRMRPYGVRATSIRRLILLVFGILVTQSVVMRQITDRLAMVEMGGVGAVRRRLQRTLADQLLREGVGYAAAVRETIAWDTLGRGSAIVLIVDESSQDERTHVLRVGIAYRGTAVPLAWAVWQQNAAQPAGSYWAAIDRVLAEAASIVPSDHPIIVVADRAYDVPGFVDRVAQRGWHWVVRAKLQGSLRFRDRRGECALAPLIARHLGDRRGAHWKGTGSVFKSANWRSASVVAVRGAQGPLVVISDLPARWSLLALYRRRFWIEPSFRNDKSAGWHWEQNQGKNLRAQTALIGAMAWASILVLCLGAQDAALRYQNTCSMRLPEHARDSLFSLGRRALRSLLAGFGPSYLPATLPHPDAPSWNDSWRAHQARQLIFGIKSVAP